MGITPQSGQFSTEDKLAALQAALSTGAITQAQYNAQYAILTGTGPEPFSFEKFFEGMFSIFNPVNWAKDFATLFNIRILIIIALIGGAFWYGLRDRIPVFNFGPYSLSGKSYTIVLPNTPDSLTLDKGGHLTIVDTKTGKKISSVALKNIKGVDNAIHPIGLEFKPFLAAGAGVSATSGHFDVGAGAHIFHIYDWQTDVLATNSGAYLGESYRLEKFMGGNTSIGVGAGPQWKGAFGALVYMTIDF